MIPSAVDRYPKWFKQLRRLPWWGQGGLLLAAAGLAALAWVTLGGGDTTANPSGQADAFSNPIWLAFTVFLRLGIVLLFILGCALALRRWKGGPLKSSLRKLKVMETLHLSPRRALHLVRVGNQEFLIGATDQSIALLSEIDAALCPEPGAQPAEEALPFPELLSTAQGRVDARLRVGEETCR